MCSSSLCSSPLLKSERRGTLRLGQVEEGNFISNQRKTVALTSKSQTKLAHFMQKLDSDWGWRLDHCPTTINTSKTIYKRSDWRWEGRHALQRSEGNSSDSVAAFHSLSNSGRTSQQENRGIRPPLVVGFGYALCLGFLFGLVGWFLVCLSFWFVFF